MYRCEMMAAVKKLSVDIGLLQYGNSSSQYGELRLLNPWWAERIHNFLQANSILQKSDVTNDKYSPAKGTSQ